MRRVYFVYIFYWQQFQYRASVKIAISFHLIMNCAVRLSVLIALRAGDIRKMVPGGDSRFFKEFSICENTIHTPTECIYVYSDARKRPEAEDKRPHLPTLLTSCSFRLKTKIHSVKFNHVSRIHRSNSIKSETISTQHLNTLKMKKLN